MKIGLACRLAVAPGQRLGDTVHESARRAEAAGLASWWAPGDRDAAGDRSHDPTLGLYAAARATTSLRVVLSGDLPSVRSAAVRAKQLASLDWFSGGRVEVGYDLDPPPSRLVDPFLHDDVDPTQRAVHRVAAMQALWTQRRPAYASDVVSFDRVIALPKTVGDRVPLTHVRATDPAVLEGFVRTCGLPGGHVAWRCGPDELVRGLEDLTKVVGAAAEGVRTTWCVDSAALPEAREAVADLGVRVDELVAWFDHVPDEGEIAALSA